MANYDSSPITPFAESFFSVKRNHSSFYLRPLKSHTQALNKLVLHNKIKMSLKQQFQCHTMPYYSGCHIWQQSYIPKIAKHHRYIDYFAGSYIRTMYIHHKSDTKIKQSLVYYRVIK